MNVRCNSCFKEYDENLGLCPFCGYSDGDSNEDIYCLKPGTEIAERYIVGEMLGLGGFGITYRAWDKKLNAMLAIKEYYPSGLVNRLPGESKLVLVATKREKEFIYGKTRFLEEARNMAKFSTHKNIVNVFDYFESNNTAYIVMEYLDGMTLSQTVESHNVPLPYEYCISIASEVCAALKAIHKEGILHRDVSPDNIMLCTNGTVKLFDFGAARFAANRDSRVTVVVKPGFAPPEQYDKVNRQDPRTDIYALGATIYYAMTGVKPDESTSRKIDDKLVPPNEIDKSIPKNVSNAVMRAMAIEPQYRFSTADEFDKILTKEKRVKTVEKERKKRRRRRTLGILFSLLLIAGAGGIFAYKWNQEKDAYTLPDATFTLYYIDDGTGEAEAAFSTVIDNFVSEYQNVKINLQGVPEDGYGAAIAETDSSTVNAVFDSGNMDVSGLKRTVKFQLGDYLLDEASYMRNGEDNGEKYPTGIACPAIYINNTKSVTLDASSLDGIMNSCIDAGELFAFDYSDSSLYSALYGGGISDFTDKSAKEMFISGEICAFFGCTSDYFDIQQSMPGQYSVIMPETENSVYRYENQWSILWGGDDSVRTAKAFVKYLNSSLAQDYVHSQSRYGGLPILKSSLDSCLELYSELSGVSDFLSRETVAPMENASAVESMNSERLAEMLVSRYKTLFTDIPEDETSKNAIAEVCAKGYMSGTDRTEFSPLSAVTYGDALIAAHRLMVAEGKAEPADETDELSEVTDWAVAMGAVSDTGFDPGSALTRECEMTLFCKIAALVGTGRQAYSMPERFADYKDIGEDFAEGMMWGVDNEFVIPTDGKTEPKLEVSRERFALDILRMETLVENRLEYLSEGSEAVLSPLYDFVMPRSVVVSAWTGSDGLRPHIDFSQDGTFTFYACEGDRAAEYKGNYEVLKYSTGNIGIKCEFSEKPSYVTSPEFVLAGGDITGLTMIGEDIGLTKLNSRFNISGAEKIQVASKEVNAESIAGMAGVWQSYRNPGDDMPVSELTVGELKGYGATVGLIIDTGDPMLEIKSAASVITGEDTLKTYYLDDGGHINAILSTSSNKQSVTVHVIKFGENLKKGTNLEEGKNFKFSIYSSISVLG